jgi:hypothetical protein
MPSKALMNSLKFWPARPVVTKDHVLRLVERAKTHKNGTSQSYRAWYKADLISNEYYKQSSVYKYGSDVPEIIEILSELNDD